MIEYQGERHTVTVVANGYVWYETTYASLSTIARAITGTSWNGPRLPHSVRGFLAGVVRTKLGLTLVSEKTGEARVYRISNLRMAESKSAALPLGDALDPVLRACSCTIARNNETIADCGLSACRLP